MEEDAGFEEEALEEELLGVFFGGIVGGWVGVWVFVGGRVRQVCGFGRWVQVVEGEVGVAIAG